MGLSQPQSLGILCVHFMAIKHKVQPRRGKPSHMAALKAEGRGQGMAQEQVDDGFAIRIASKGLISWTGASLGSATIVMTVAVD